MRDPLPAFRVFRCRYVTIASRNQDADVSLTSAGTGFSAEPKRRRQRDGSDGRPPPAIGAGVSPQDGFRGPEKEGQGANAQQERPCGQCGWPPVSLQSAERAGCPARQQAPVAKKFRKCSAAGTGCRPSRTLPRGRFDLTRLRLHEKMRHGATGRAPMATQR
jgi:hypothetical protein